MILLLLYTDYPDRQFTFLRSKAFLVCYSVTDRESLTNAVMKWVPMARNWSATALVVLVATKVDLRGGRESESYENETENGEDETENGEEESENGDGEIITDKSADKLITASEGSGVAKGLEIKYMECTSTKPLDTFISSLIELIETHYNKDG